MSGLAPSVELRAGDSVDGRYTILAPISSGAMGAVYRARGPDGREVAVKRLLDLSQAARFGAATERLGAADYALP